MTKVARRFVYSISSVKSFLADVLFPFFCVGCGREGEILCDTCRAGIEWYGSRECVFCPRNTDVFFHRNVCRECTFEQSIEAVIVATHYHERVIRDLIYQLKYEYVERVALVLGELLFAYGDENKLWEKYSGFTLVPVPLHQRRFFERGFNQSELITLVLSRLLDFPCHATYLRRVRYTTSQVNLSCEARQENVSSSFEASLEVSKKDIILVDDVFTTGATLREGARALKARGANRIVALVVARG